MANKDELDSAIQNSRDFDYNYFGFKTLERSYLMKIDGKIAERPQHMLMRVSVGIHGEDIKSAIKVSSAKIEILTHVMVFVFRPIQTWQTNTTLMHLQLYSMQELHVLSCPHVFSPWSVSILVMAN